MAMHDFRRVMRVLKEDADFVTVEIPKRMDVAMTVAPLPGSADVPHFFTFAFLRKGADGKMETWDPFAEPADA